MHPSDASPPPFLPCPGLGGHFRRCSTEVRTPPQVLVVDADALKPRLVKPWAPPRRQRPVAPRGGLRRARKAVPSSDINAPLKTRRTPQNDEEEDDAPRLALASIRRLKLRRDAANLGEQGGVPSTPGWASTIDRISSAPPPLIRPPRAPIKRPPRLRLEAPQPSPLPQSPFCPAICPRSLWFIADELPDSVTLVRA